MAVRYAMKMLLPPSSSKPLAFFATDGRCKTSAPHLLIIFALLFVLCGFLPAAFAAISFVKNIGVASSTTTGTTLSVTVPTAGVAAGTSIIVSLAINPSAGTVSCTDTRSNSYVIDRDITNGSATTGVRTVILSAHNVLSLASGNTITCTHPSVTARAMSANQFSGIASTSARDQAAAATGNSTAASSGATPTTTQAAELLVGTVGVEGPSTETFTVGASYTIMGRRGTSGGTSTNNITVNPEYRLVTATGAYSAGGTLSVAHRWAASIVTYKAAPAPTKLVISSVNSGTNPTAGTGFSVIVQAQTATGTPANVAAATAVSLSRIAGSGALGGTTAGTIAAGTNQVTISGVTYTKAESGIVLRATRSSGDSLTAGDSAPFTVNPGAATKLAFTVQPGNSAAGSVISGPPTVVVQDSLNNVVTSSTASITIAIGANPGGATLGGTKTKNAASGAATFGDLTLDVAANGYTLTASSTGLTAATSAGFNVTGVPPTKLAVISVNGGSNPTAGTAFSTIVQAQDAAGTARNVSNATAVRLAVKTGTGALQGTITGMIAAGTNQVTITGTSYTKAEPGVVLTASRTSGVMLTAGDSASFTVNPGAAAKLAFTVQPANSTAGSIISSPPTITVQDSLGNRVPASTAPITIAIGTNPGGGALGGITAKNAASGVASFLDLRIDKPGTGYTLTATSTGLTGATSGAFAVSGGAAAKLAFITQPLNSNVGSTISGPPTIAVQDSFGNTVTNSNAAITVSIGNNPSAGSLIGTKTISVSSGIASFPSLFINQPGNGYTLTASSTGLTGAASNAFSVNTVIATRTLTVSKIGSGTITSSTGGINCGSTCSASLNEGAVVTLNATPAAEWTFAGWTGNFDCSDGSVTLHTDKTCTANFTTTTPGFVQITSPTPDAVINSSSVLVQGTLTVPPGTEVGVTVNGTLAAARGGVFAALVPVTPDTTSLTAVATTAPGTTASHSVAISVSPAPEPSVTLNASPQSGLTPVVTVYTIRTDFVPTQVELDVNSDGTVDYTAGADFNGVSFILSQPGVYVATARVTDSLGNVFTANAVVQVQDRDELDARLQAKWAGMKDALQRGDIEGAVLIFAANSKADFQAQLTALDAAGGLSQLANDLGSINLIRVRDAAAEYDLRSIRNGFQYSFHVLFVVDTDGLWKLAGF